MDVDSALATSSPDTDTDADLSARIWMFCFFFCTLETEASCQHVAENSTTSDRPSKLGATPTTTRKMHSKSSLQLSKRTSYPSKTLLSLCSSLRLDLLIQLITFIKISLENVRIMMIMMMTPLNTTIFPTATRKTRASSKTSYVLMASTA